MKTVEFRVRPVVRYLVTQFTKEEAPNSAIGVGSATIGEFANEELATRIAISLAQHSDGDVVIGPDRNNPSLQAKYITAYMPPEARERVAHEQALSSFRGANTVTQASNEGAGG